VSPPETSKPELLIADHAPTRLGVRIALGAMVHVCAEADDAEHAISAAQREQPDVCLVGLEIPGGGIAATRGICGVAPDSAVIVLATSREADDLLACVQAGAVGYLPSDIGAPALRRAIAAARGGEAAVPRSMVLALVHELQGSAPGNVGLTARETQVLALLRRGESTIAIADRLGISPVTVRRHIAATVHKTGVEGRAALARGGPIALRPPSAVGSRRVSGPARTEAEEALEGAPTSRGQTGDSSA
jgi:DNA-binding NarL/FixJ family response regulator